MLIDVSHAIWPGMPRIGILPEVRIDPVTSIADGAPLNTAELHLATHAGTHVDAPAHAFAGAATIDELPVETFVGPGVVVSVARGAGEEITVADVRDAPVTVEPGDIVLLHTGWDEVFEEDAYHDHPYPSAELAAWLVDAGVKMLGVDCLTVDAPPPRRGPDFAFPVHRTLLGAGVPIIENLTGLGAAGGQRVRVQALPLRIADGDAGHARVVLEVPDGQ